MAERSKKNNYPEHTWNPSKDPATGADISHEQSQRMGLSQIAGWVYAKNEDVGKNNSKTYYLKTESGAEVSVWGTSVLDSQMDDVQIGTWVRIVWLGKKAPKKDPRGPHYHDFEVFEDTDKPMPGYQVRTEQAAPVQTTPTNSAASVADDQARQAVVDDTFGKPENKAPWE